jgi:hypothetical protein
MKNLNSDLVSRKEFDLIATTCADLRRDLKSLTDSHNTTKNGLILIGVITAIAIVAFLVVLI